MASWNFTSETEATTKAGANANAPAAARLEEWSDMVEGRIVAETRRDWITDYATLSTEIKGILNDVASDLIAMKIIAYDMSGYTSRTEAQTMLDQLRDNAQQGLKILSDFKSNTIKSVD